jgi:hypothetical protein
VLSEITEYLTEYFTRKVVGAVAVLHIGHVEIWKVLELRNKSFFI